MTIDEHTDPLLRAISRLPAVKPDEQRAERLRARCRARLIRRAPDNQTPGLGPALVAGVCLAYLSAVVHGVLRLRDGF